jgi:hypothetical protein
MKENTILVIAFASSNKVYTIANNKPMPKKKYIITQIKGNKSNIRGDIPRSKSNKIKKGSKVIKKLNTDAPRVPCARV